MQPDDERPLRSEIVYSTPFTVSLNGVSFSQNSAFFAYTVDTSSITEPNPDAPPPRVEASIDDTHDDRLAHVLGAIPIPNARGITAAWDALPELVARVGTERGDGPELERDPEPVWVRAGAASTPGSGVIVWAEFRDGPNGDYLLPDPTVEGAIHPDEPLPPERFEQGAVRLVAVGNDDIRVMFDAESFECAVTNALVSFRRAPNADDRECSSYIRMLIDREIERRYLYECGSDDERSPIERSYLLGRAREEEGLAAHYTMYSVDTAGRQTATFSVSLGEHGPRTLVVEFGRDELGGVSIGANWHL